MSNQGGRPSDYTEELAGQIADRLACGEPLAKICEDDGMPHRVTVNRWCRAHPEFAVIFARAREDAGEVWAERALQAALRADPITANASRLKYDALRWYASKLAPKLYGDRVQHANAAGDADPVVHITYSLAKRTCCQATGDILRSSMRAFLSSVARYRSSRAESRMVL
jgi:hypothetical protein